MKPLFKSLLSQEIYRNVRVTKIMYRWLIFSVRPVGALKYYNPKHKLFCEDTKK